MDSETRLLVCHFVGDRTLESCREFLGELSTRVDIDISQYNAENTEFNNGRGWIPIGFNVSDPFRGNFDGDGKSITGLYINSGAVYTIYNGLGLFGVMENHAELVYSNNFIGQKLQYIHQNPVRAGIVSKPEDYLYSSARNYAEIYGLIEIDKVDVRWKTVK